MQQDTPRRVPARIFFLEFHNQEFAYPVPADSLSGRRLETPKPNEGYSDQIIRKPTDLKQDETRLSKFTAASLWDAARSRTNLEFQSCHCDRSREPDPGQSFQGLCHPPFGTSASCSTTPSATQYNIQTSNTFADHRATSMDSLLGLATGLKGNEHAERAQRAASGLASLKRSA